MWIIGLSVIIVFIIVIIYIFYYSYYRRYYDFIHDNSKALEDINNINKSYSFKNIENILLYHEYDNEKMYNSVSCYDYLVYDLQFIKNRTKYLNIINDVNYNISLYSEYTDEVNSIKYGIYKEDITKYNLNRLINIEKELVKKELLTPTIKFKLDVILSYRNMGDRLIARKYYSFNDYDVCNAIDLIKDKNGNFYNNRKIWDSICRVERAKVSNKMRFAIYKRDHYRCKMCGRIYDPEYLEIDHIYPIAKGGKSNIDNLQTLCKKCNYIKGDKVL